MRWGKSGSGATGKVNNMEGKADESVGKERKNESEFC